jgi:TP901 family phage tail tape measure protein
VPDRSVTYEFKGKFDSLRSGLVASGRSLDDFGTKLLALDKNGAKMRAGLTHFGDLGGKIALGAAAGLAAIVGVAANFDHSMSLVQAATGESADGMEKLRAAALKAGADTAFSASEAADAITALSKAGVSTKDILAGGLTGSLSLAAAGELDVANAAEIAATTMTQFGLAGGDVGHIADVLAAAAGKAQGDVTDMAGALNYVGPVAHQMGISLEETAGSIAELASQGILGSQAGTSLRGMLTSLTSPSKMAKDTMDEYGISLYDTQGNMIGFRGIAQQLQASMGDLDNKTRDQALGQIFGNEQITAARILFAGGAKDVDKWTKAVDDQGFAADQAATKMDNLAGDLEQFKGSLETALIGAGEGSQGPLRKVLQTMTGLVNKFNELPPAAQSVVSGFLGITAILGGGLWFTSKVVSGIADTRQALRDLGWEAGRTRGLIAGVAKAGVGFGVLIGSLDLLQKAFDALSQTQIDTSSLGRDVEALADGRVTDNLSKMSFWLEDIQHKTGHDWNPLSWVSSWDPTGFEDANDGLNAMDDALAGLVESGRADEAAAAMAQIAKQADDAGLSTGELTTIFNDYQTALQNAGLAPTASDLFGSIAKKSPGMAAFLSKLTGITYDAADATGNLGKATEHAGKKAAQAGPLYEKMSKAMKDARSAARSTAEEFFGLGDKVDKAKVSLNGWIRDLRKQTDALRNFRENAQQAAKKGLDEGLIASLEKAGPAGALRMKQLANATQSEIARANKAWQAGEREVEKYTNFVGGVPKKVSTDLTVNPGNSIPTIHGVITALSSVHDKVVHIQTVFSHYNATPATHQADGGFISGPGGPRDDAIPARLSDGEFVVNAATTKRLRPWLEMENAKGFADGGPVGLQSLTLRETRHGDDETTRQAKEAAQALKGLKSRLQEATKSLEAEQKQRDALVEKMKSLGSTVAGGLQSNLFGDLNPWTSGSIFDSAVSSLRGDLGREQQLRHAIRSLRSKGLTGPALAYVLSEGGLTGALAFADEAGGDLREFAHLYNQRSREAKEIGNLAGRSAFGAAFRDETHELRQIKAEVQRLRHAVQAADHHNQHEHGKTRDSTKRGASNGQRNRRHDR